MRITTYKGEKSIGELTARIFEDLTPGQRRSAEKALLRANPGLKDIAKIKTGSVLLIPDLRGVAGAKARAGEQPAVDLVRDIADAVARYQKRLTDAVEVESRDIEAAAASLESGPAVALVKRF